jgi:hypothetical protein
MWTARSNFQMPRKPDWWGDYLDGEPGAPDAVVAQQDDQPDDQPAPSAQEMLKARLSARSDTPPLDQPGGLPADGGQPAGDLEGIREAAHNQAWSALSDYAQSDLSRDLDARLAADLPDLLSSAPRIDAAPQHWSVKDRSVILSPEVREKMDPIAQEFYDRTGKNLVATDGNRTPAIQAQRMYDKFTGGDTTTYHGPAGREIRSIFDHGHATGLDKKTIVANMTARIQQQLAGGHPVSNHLLDRGVDFHDKDFSPAERQILGDIIRRNSGRPLREGVPPHTHASF